MGAAAGVAPTGKAGPSSPCVSGPRGRLDQGRARAGVCRPRDRGRSRQPVRMVSADAVQTDEERTTMEIFMGQLTWKTMIVTVPGRFALLGPAWTRDPRVERSPHPVGSSPRARLADAPAMPCRDHACPAGRGLAVHIRYALVPFGGSCCGLPVDKPCACRAVERRSHTHQTISEYLPARLELGPDLAY